MIRVYKYFTLSDEYEMLRTTEETLPWLGQMRLVSNGTRLAQQWTPMRVEATLSDEPVLQGDFPAIGWAAPVFSKRAWNVLRPLIDQVVEALPLIHPLGQPYYVINVLDITDCLDLDRCQTNKSLDNPRFSRIYSYAFNEDMIKGKHIFKSVAMKGLDTYVSSTFTRLVEDNGLCGLRFPQIYPPLPENESTRPSAKEKVSGTDWKEKVSGTD